MPFRLAARSLALLLLVFLVHIQCNHAEPLDNRGTEFLLAFLTNSDKNDTQIINSRELQITGQSPTVVDIEYPLGTMYTSTTITPGEVTYVDLPLNVSMDWIPNDITANVVRVVAQEDIVVYQINRKNFSTDAALGLPVDVMNTEFIITDYNSTLLPMFESEFVVYASLDGTTVEIQRPDTNETIEVQLNRGEGYMSTFPGSQTGTIVTSNRPVGVVNGNQCSNVPLGVFACDHLFEVAQPVQTWGREIGFANLPNRPDGTIYRVVAAKDDTTITLDGEFVTSLNRGDFYDTPVPLTDFHVFRGDKPIFVSQFMTGQTSPGPEIGDPSMGAMLPFTQYVDNYVFSTPPGEQFPTNYVTIIAKSNDVFGGTVFLDDEIADPTLFTAIPTTDYWAAVILISPGVHTTSSADPHGITISGYAEFDSYLYPGGFLNPIVDENAPIITGEVEPGVGFFLATDNQVSEDINGNGVLDDGEDLNGNGFIDEDTGIFSLELFESTNLEFIAVDFLTADPTADFTVTLIEPSQPGSGIILVTDGAGNIAGEFIELFPATSAPTPAPRSPRKGKGKGKGRSRNSRKSSKKSKKRTKIQRVGGNGGTRTANRRTGKSRTRPRTRGKGSGGGASAKNASKKFPVPSRIRTRSRGMGKESDKASSKGSKKGPDDVPLWKHSSMKQSSKDKSRMDKPIMDKTAMDQPSTKEKPSKSTNMKKMKRKKQKR
eukprot:scaffold1019_cov172-Amphora_coffeaeformis.AAC.12